MAQSYILSILFSTGVAVAAAFCPLESPAVTLPTELSFGVSADIGTYNIIYSAQGTMHTCTYVSH